MLGSISISLVLLRHQGEYGSTTCVLSFMHYRHNQSLIAAGSPPYLFVPSILNRMHLARASVGVCNLPQVSGVSCYLDLRACVLAKLFVIASQLDS